MGKRKRVLLIATATLILTFAGLMVLKSYGRTQTVTLDVAGEHGRKVVGYITADGTSYKFVGTLPIKLEYRACRTEFAFVQTEPIDDKAFSVHVALNGEAWGHCQCPEGIKGSLERTGIKGWGTNGGGIGGLNPMEIAALK